MSRTKCIRLNGRYYRRVPIDNAGYAEEELELEAEKTALISLHCWDIGCPGGPPVDERFCVGMGYKENFEEGYRIICEYVRPALDVAREAGLVVFHIQSARIARLYPRRFKYEVEEPEPQAAPPEAIPGYRKRILERSHGKDYEEGSGLASMDFPAIVAPLPDEPIAWQTAQLDRIAREASSESHLYGLRYGYVYPEGGWRYAAYVQSGVSRPSYSRVNARSGMPGYFRRKARPEMGNPLHRITSRRYDFLRGFYLRLSELDR